MANNKMHAFSLIELMIALLISSLIIASMLAVSITGERIWQIGDANIELQQDLRKGEDWIIEELRQGGVSTISDVPADGLWYNNSITFEIPANVINGAIVWQDDSIQYFLGGLGGKQLIRVVGSMQRVLANNIVSFQARRQASTPSIVEIVIRSEKKSTKGDVLQANSNFKVKLRN